MVPSGPIAGAVLTGGRWEPQVMVGATAVGLVGQGRSAVSNRNVHWSFAAGIGFPSASTLGSSEAQETAVATPAAVTLTSHDCGTSTSHESFADPSSCMTL